MVKLKISRSQLQVLTACFNPAIIENAIDQAQSFNDMRSVANLFAVLDVAEAFTKKYFFTNSPKYKISLSNANASALFIRLAEYEAMQWDAYTTNVLQEVKSTIHQQLTNFQRRFYGTNNQHGFTVGNSLDQGAHKQLAGSSGRGADNAPHQITN